MERLHIVVAGACNSGKSSLINMIVGQKVSLVSSSAGTTTDPVRKLMEFPHIGPAVMIDTPGFDDSTDLGPQRVAIAEKALDEADVVLLLVGENPDSEVRFKEKVLKRKLPLVEVVNKVDLGRDIPGNAVGVSAISEKPEEKAKIFEAILRVLPESFGNVDLLRGLCGEGDVVILVMPQDSSAPVGRLILPQVQTIRALLDKQAVTLCVTPEKFVCALSALKETPKLVITDSQAFAKVAPLVPEQTAFTSFSVLMAAMKGDIEYFSEGGRVLDRLNEKSRVLIAEACTHVPQHEDIGRKKIPMMLRKKIGEGLTIEHVSGKDFPEDLSRYDLVIHCGACMFNRSYVMSRVERARSAGVPMTNYGITLAYLTGVLDKVRM